MSREIEKFIQSRSSFRKTRIPSLYSDFSNLKELNPEGYDANIDAWGDLLVALVKSDFGDSKVSISTTKPHISHYLRLSDRGKPLGMKIVLKELVSQKQFVPLSVYEINDDIYVQMCHKQSNFAYYLSPMSWVRWTLDSIGLGGNFIFVDANGDLVNERYICWEAMLEMSDKCYHEISSFIQKEGTHSSKLHNKDTLYNILSDKFKVSMIDIEILLILWSRDMKLCQIRKKDTNTYIKFDTKEEIEDQDIGIINLQNSIVKLENRNMSLEKKIADLDTKIKFTIREKAYNNEYTKKLMILKRSFSKSLFGSTASLHQLNKILVSINDANANNEIYSQLVKSAKILSQVNSKVNLDDIDSIKMDIGEQIEMTNLINDSLSNEVDVNDEEIESELQALAQEVSKNMSQAKVQTATKNNEETDEDLLKKLNTLSVDNTEVEAPDKKPILEME